MKLKKLTNVLLAPLLAVPMLLSPITAHGAGVTVYLNEAGSAQESSELDALLEVLDYLDAYNIEGVDRELFLENAIRGMVYTLDDPYSDYFSAEELEEFEGSLNQEYVGIGVTLRFTNNNLTVTQALPGSPALAAGIQQGDIISKVDGVKVTGIEDIYRIQGIEGTKVALDILRDTKPMTITITRGHFTVPAVTGKYFSESKVGYIALSSFTEQSDKQFAAELGMLRKAGMESLVLDLRDNSGGYVSAAINIAENFIEQGTVMYISGQDGKLEPITIEDGQSLGLPVIILTNEMTASASEILTGALQDNHIATVVGTTTYGKARIQNLFPLSNGSSLKLTVQKYLTPNRKDFNHVGLTPDYEVKNNAAAQLVSALQLAGMQALELKGSSSSLIVNGISVNGYMDIVQSGDNLYVPSRVLNAIVDGEVAWNSKQQQLTITPKLGGSAGFTVSNQGIKIIDNETYVEIHQFQKKFPRLKWSYQQGTITLSYK